MSVESIQPLTVTTRLNLKWWWSGASLVGSFILLILLITPPQLQYHYQLTDLVARSNKYQTSGFLLPRTDPAGNTYSWTSINPSLTLDFQSAKPINIIFEIRSAAVAGGPDVPVAVIANGKLAGQIQPDPYNPQFQFQSVKFIPNTFPSDKINLQLGVTPYIVPGENQPLGTMLKSITIDKTQAWSTISKRLWLYWALPVLALLALGLSWTARKYKLVLAGYGASLSCFGGFGFMVVAVNLLGRMGMIDKPIYLLWIAGSFMLGLLFAVAALTLPLRVSDGAGLHQLTYRWLFIKQRSKLLPGVITVWLVILIAGSLLLYGRYNWNEAEGQFAFKSYFSSLYFFWLVLPVSYYLTLILSNKQKLALVVASLTFFVTTLPYYFLGLGGFRYQLSYIAWNSPGAQPEMIWYPQAFDDAPFPNDRIFMVGLMLIFTGLAFWLASSKNKDLAGLSRASVINTLKRVAPFIGIFFLILVQTWLHSGLRSPYTYTAHYEQPPEKNYWYHLYLFENYQGAANSDVGFFLSLERYFSGYPEPVATLLIRRSFIHYFTSHFSYFWNSYYVYLVVNTLLWLVAVVCTYYYVKRVLAKPKVAIYAAALVMCGNGFIYFAAQPMSYLAAYTVVILVLFLFEYLLVNSQTSWLQVLLFGAVLSLCSATYDLFPLYPMLLLYSPFRKVKLKFTVIALIFSYVLYSGFLVLQFNFLGLQEQTGNSELAAKAVENLLKWVTGFEFGRFYATTVGLLKTYVQNLSYAFFILVFLLALVGLLFGSNRRERLLLLLLLIPSILLNLYFYYGGIVWATNLLIELPRLSYIAYPAIYIAAALALEYFSGLLEKTRLAKWSAYLPWLIIILVFAWHNLDIFGLPSPYYHFYWPLQSPWLNKI